MNARLIRVDTVETIAQARDWVPLTPTVERQLAADVKSTRIRVGGDGPDPRNGVWRGSGTCGDLTFGLALSIIVNPDDTVVAMQTYFPANAGDEVDSGVLEMEGRFDPQKSELSLVPADWLFQPRGHSALGLTGTMDLDEGKFDGTYGVEGCQTFSLRRVAP